MDDPVVVFDTVVFVRALINPYSFWGRLVFEHYHEYRLVISPQVLREYIEVMNRPELTEDRDLLDLDQHQGTRIIPAHEFLRMLKTQHDSLNFVWIPSCLIRVTF
jgi:predicted nucleic acid-binding protein